MINWLKTNWKTLLFNLLINTVEESAQQDKDGNFYVEFKINKATIQIFYIQ
jgi:hypothetical protein